MQKLKNMTALITGAGRGIGRATALLFARNGADLILIARTAKQLAETAKLCRAEGAEVIAERVDLTELTNIDTLFDKLGQSTNRIDILINNAAMFDGGPIADYPIASAQAMMTVNLFAAMALSQRVIGMMPESGGCIVNVSSLSGCFGTEKFPGFGVYNISKYALWGLTEILALENRERGIRVNQVSPSGVDTEMFRRAVPPGVEPSLQPEDVAEKILYLASDDSKPLTGENILMTGE